jgi:hypothetical protein
MSSVGPVFDLGLRLAQLVADTIAANKAKDEREANELIIATLRQSPPARGPAYDDARERIDAALRERNDVDELPGRSDLGGLAARESARDTVPAAPPTLPGGAEPTSIYDEPEGEG